MTTVVTQSDLDLLDEICRYLDDAIEDLVADSVAALRRPRTKVKRRRSALPEDGLAACLRSAVRAGVAAGASRETMRAAMHAAEVTSRRWLRQIDEPAFELLSGHYERVSIPAH